MFSGLGGRSFFLVHRLQHPTPARCMFRFRIRASGTFLCAAPVHFIPGGRSSVDLPVGLGQLLLEGFEGAASVVDVPLHSSGVCGGEGRGIESPYSVLFCVSVYPSYMHPCFHATHGACPGCE